MDENRRAPRRRVLKAGTIEFGCSAFSCVVRDRSATGAKLDVPSPIGIPECFVLVAGGSRLPCHVVRRKENRIGIAFD
jgi:PilZ domain-containing protein